MQSTRWQILGILKRNGNGTVDGIASALKLAPMTIRQHLAVLERDSYISTQEVRRQTGRPHYVYSLTGEGEDLFPKSYYLLADRILQEVQALEGEEISGLTGDEKLNLVFKKMAERMASAYLPQMEGKGLEERVSEAIKILKDEGAISEWKKTDDGYEIFDYNCPYNRIAENYNYLCLWHQNFLTKLLQAEVTQGNCLAAGEGHCHYLVREGNGKATPTLS